MKRSYELKIVLLGIITGMVLMLISSVSDTVGCGPPPQCPPCYSWNGSQCVGGCPCTCWTCDASRNSCVLWGCGPNDLCCTNIFDGTCHCCNVKNCMTDCNVLTGICKSACEPEQTCEDGQCKCNECFTIVTVPPSVTPPSCPECSHFFTGCGDATIEVINGYEKWAVALPNEAGFCKNPSKTDIVGYIFPCEEDWDIGKIITCAAQAPVCALLCRNPRTPLELAACVGCLVAAGVTCGNGVCSFVEDCIPYDDPDVEDDVMPIRKEVIDWSKDFGDVCTGE
jgi:hypothetical protein